MLQVCIDEAKGDYKAANADVNASVKGYYALKDALFQIPTLRYPEASISRTGTVPVTMRQLAADIASHAGDGGACGLNGQDM